MKQHGVQATKEVQLAALQVVRENVRLRELIRQFGVDEKVIDGWVRGERVEVDQIAQRNGSFAGTSPISEAKDAQSHVKPTTCPHRLAQSQREPRREEAVSYPCNVVSDSPCNAPRLEGEALAPTAPIAKKCAKKCGSSSSNQTPCSGGNNGVAELLSPVTAKPCKLVTHLTANPGADMTQLQVTESEHEGNGENGGVQCAKAYKLLIRYATTEEKLDYISQALEDGCVPNEGPEGGCKVKNSAIWAALDGLCI
jgi:hypothetical protein